MTHLSADTRYLPGLLGELARAGFGGKALLLAYHWGGTKRYIPATPCEHHALVQLIGLNAARVLADQWGGGHHDIPRAAVLDDLKRKILSHPGTTRETAIALRCTERWVREVRAGSDPAARATKPIDPRQISMFD
ncbi:MAG: hypothetical protein JXQ84_07795 [Rhodospirillaceae bacterium]|nr:hypothetical protein [Rhodospirillaceae bacterium]